MNWGTPTVVITGKFKNSNFKTTICINFDQFAKTLTL